MAPGYLSAPFLPCPLRLRFSSELVAGACDVSFALVFPSPPRGDTASGQSPDAFPLAVSEDSRLRSFSVFAPKMSRRSRVMEARFTERRRCKALTQILHVEFDDVRGAVSTHGSLTRC